MPQIDPEIVKQMRNTTYKIEAVQIGNMIGFKGPWLPDAYFDSWSEALRENQKEKARLDQKKEGVNETWQTPEQEKAFEKKKKIQLDRQRKAELAATMASQNK